MSVGGVLTRGRGRGLAHSHVLLGVDAAVGRQLVSLRQLGDALLQVLHLGVHGVNGLPRTEGEVITHNEDT